MFVLHLCLNICLTVVDPTYPEIDRRDSAPPRVERTASSNFCSFPITQINVAVEWRIVACLHLDRCHTVTDDKRWMTISRRHYSCERASSAIIASCVTKEISGINRTLACESWLMMEIRDETTSNSNSDATACNRWCEPWSQHWCRHIRPKRTTYVWHNEGPKNGAVRRQWRKDYSCVDIIALRLAAKLPIRYHEWV